MEGSLYKESLVEHGLMARTYSDCFYCGGAVEERLIPREIRWGGELLVFENVPVGVCTQCGEKFILPEVAKAIDRVLQRRTQPSRILEVPVYMYEPDVA
jgi:YgiT-type zinc finger domain-containing protein